LEFLEPLAWHDFCFLFSEGQGFVCREESPERVKLPLEREQPHPATGAPMSRDKRRLAEFIVISCPFGKGEP